MPDRFRDLHFHRKNSNLGEKKGQIQTKYHTIILDNDETFKISGESDAVIFYNNTCVFVWEDKNLDKTLTTANEKGQIIAEVKGFAEAFKKATRVEPTVFPGVLTSGVVFSISRYIFRNGGSSLHLTQPLSLVNEKYEIIEENVMAVTKLLIDNLLYCGKLMKVIDDSLVPPQEHEEEEEDQRKFPGNDDEEEDNDDGDAKKSPHKENQPNTTTPAKNKIGTNKTNNTGTKSKKTPFYDCTNPLSAESLHWHNIYMRKALHTH